MLRGIGLYFDLRNPPQWQQPWGAHYARALDVIAHAEAVGTDEIWFTEIAQRRRELRLGTARAAVVTDEPPISGSAGEWKEVATNAV